MDEGTRQGILTKKLALLAPETETLLNEKRFAEIFKYLYSHELKYDATRKIWLFYDGICWREDVGSVITMKLANEFYDILRVYSSRIADPVIFKKFSDNWLKLGQYHKREVLVKDARAIMAVYQEDFDKDPNLINFLNTTLDLFTGKTHDHTPDDLITKVCNCNYNPDANSDDWIKFVNEVMLENEAKIRYIQEACGYCLTAKTNLEFFVVFLGTSTRNGKSTFIETFSKMMGTYATTIQPEVLAITNNRNGDSASPELAKLLGVRFLAVSEPPKSMRLNVALVKELTGGDKISARQLYGKPFEFVPQFKLFINTNSLPVVADNTLFQSDRVRVITFDRHFKQEEQNKNLKQYLQQPEILSSVFNWAYEGLLTLQKYGDNPPECVQAATNEYMYRSDKVQLFFDERLKESDENLHANDVYKVYCSWCSEKAYTAEGKNAFFDSLKDRGLIKKSATIHGKTVRNVVVGYSFIDDSQPITILPPYTLAGKVDEKHNDVV